MKMKKTSTLVSPDIWVTLNPSLKQFLLALSSWWTYEVKDKQWNPIIVWKETLKISKFNIPDFSWISDKEIKEAIKIELKIDISTPEWIHKLNNIFEIALSIYADTRIRKVFEEKWVKYDLLTTLFPFKSEKDVIDFLRWPEKKTWEWKLSCLVAKICSSVNNALNTPQIQNLIEKESEVYQKLKWPLSLKEVWDEYTWSILGKSFIMYGRPKSLAACIQKSLNHPEYNNLINIKDWIGYTFEIEGWDKEILLLMQAVHNVVIALKWHIIDYDNKWIKLNNFHTDDKQFEALLKSKPTKPRWKKETSTDEYKEIKIVWYIEVVDEDWNTSLIPFEMKFAHHWNKNQKWLSFQWVYAYLDKYINGNYIRNLWRWYITKEDLYFLTTDFFEDLDNQLSNNPETKWKITKEKYLEELWVDLQKNWFIGHNLKYENMRKSWKLLNHIMPWLRKYYESKLNEVILEDGSKVFTSYQWLKLSDIWIYPPMSLIKKQ